MGVPLIILVATLLSACGPTAMVSRLDIVGGLPVRSNDPLAKTTVNFLNEGTRKSFCTGTLISKRVVLTAAHCLQNLKQDSVVGFGLTSDTAILVKIQKVKLHPDYDETQIANDRPTGPANDIGVAFLETAAPKEALPIKLSSSIPPPSVGDALVLAGFGWSGVNPPVGSGTLRKVSTQITSMFTDRNEFLFGAHPGKSACIGDSGGPAYVLVKDSLTLVGVISRGDRLCTETGIVTDVSPYIDWILEPHSNPN